MKTKNISHVFQRVEKKYLMDQETYDSFIKRISQYAVLDHYGLTNIRNIYYDTDNFNLIRNSIESPQYKEKLRLRSYGAASLESTVFLEVKKKYRGIVYKRRMALTLQEANDIFDHHIFPKQNGQIAKEIKRFCYFYDLKPSILLSYERKAFYGKENHSIRITADHNIRSRDYNLDLSSNDKGALLLDSNEYLIEIKVASAMPMWLVRILSDLKIYPSSFSKYGNVFKKYYLNSAGKNEAIKGKEYLSDREAI